MSLQGSLHVRSTDTVRVVAYEPTKLDWVSVEFFGDGHIPIHCDDADTAMRLAQGFMAVAAAMRARRGIPEPVTPDLLEPVEVEG